MKIFKDPSSYKLSDVKGFVSPKVLAVDIGTRKHGVAISCDNLKFAYPLDICYDFQSVYKLYTAHRCKTLVVGYPFTVDGDGNEVAICNLVDLFVNDFANLNFANLPAKSLDCNPNSSVFYVNENFSSATVSKQLFTKNSKKKSLTKLIDASVACYLLRNFLDELNV